MQQLRFFSLLTALLFVSFSASAQLEMRGLEIGPWAGASVYFGDLNTDFRLDRINAAGGIGARYNFNHRLAAKVSFNYGKIEAYDSDSTNPFERNRNLSFESAILDGTAQFEFNFLPYYHGHKDYWFTPYVFGGISVFRYDPKTVTDAGDLVSLRELGTEGQLRGEEYLVIASALTAGVGFKWDLSYEISMDIHLSIRNANTDYLDDVSTIYPDISDLRRQRGQLAVDLSDRGLMLDSNGDRIDRDGEQRGDPTVNDRYIFVGIGFNYYFGDVRCPTYGGKRR